MMSQSHVRQFPRSLLNRPSSNSLHSALRISSICFHWSCNYIFLRASSEIYHVYELIPQNVNFRPHQSEQLQGHSRPGTVVWTRSYAWLLGPGTTSTSNRFWRRHTSSIYSPHIGNPYDLLKDIAI